MVYGKYVKSCKVVSCGIKMFIENGQILKFMWKKQSLKKFLS